MKAYCLFCETAKCGFVAQAAELLFGCRAISPKMIQHTWSRGQEVDRMHDLLPGYVFLYVEGEPLDIQSVRSIHGVIRCLSSEGFGYVLQGNDEQMALMLLKKDGVIGKTPVYQEGEMIHLTKRAFDGVEAKILRVEHRNRHMQIELMFASQSVRTWVEYEIVAERE
ncbi:MAG: hypothetical protein IJI38_00280 [Clostridia bacterium]|nr:hypothetical protein [Clostridia bacterium]